MSLFLLTSCNKQKAMILFNQNPITKQNLLDNATEFTRGKRFHYIFITEKPLKTNIIRVRVLKRDEKADSYPTKLVYSNDFKLRKDQVYYYNDYLVLNDSGAYCMMVYASDNLRAPLATADFKISSSASK